jgi:hypothetical protein
MDRERMSLGEVGTIKAKIPWDPDPCKTDYNSVLINHVFPSLKGKAKVLDEFLRRIPKHPQSLEIAGRKG